LTASSFEGVVLFGISTPFGMLSPTRRQITHVLLTRAPLYRGRSPFSCDLHVLGAPLTFVLSQDQTLQLNFWCLRTDPKVVNGGPRFLEMMSSPLSSSLLTGEIVSHLSDSRSDSGRSLLLGWSI
jgi:hypothetical protein